MRKFIAIFLIIIICLSLTSCDYNITSIESLMRPPKLSGESSLLQKAFEESVADINGVIMKTPVSGQYRSSYLYFDLEKDGEQEAIVFYSNPMDDSMVCANVFKHVNDEWKNISKIKGKNEEVYEVNFADINGDNISEILISWTGAVASDKVNSSDFGTGNERLLSVYSCDGITTTLLKTETYSNLFLKDLNNDGSDEIVIFKIVLADNDKQTTSRIIVFNSDFSIKSDEKLSMTGMLEINNITTDNIEINEKKHTRIFVDGAISEVGVITEIIDIENVSFDVSLPLYETNQSQEPLTLRASRTYCNDIDNDGVIEIPTDEVLPFGYRITENSNQQNELYMTVWSEYVDSILSVDFKCLMNSSFNYMFVFPDDILSTMSAVYNDNNCTLTFYSVDSDGQLEKELFSIKAFYEQDWEDNHNRYVRFAENSTYVYGYLILYEDDNENYEEFVLENFQIMNQE